jgi:hypothetical protein
MDRGVILSLGFEEVGGPNNGEQQLAAEPLRPRLTRYRVTGVGRG